MEIPASGDEVAALLARCFPGDPLAVMAEVRERVVRMWRELPLLWTQRACGELTSFSGSAQPGEAYTLQVAVYAVSTPVEVTSVSFSDFAVEGGGEPLPAAAFSCMNTNVTDYWGRVRSNTQTVAPRTVLALWMRTAIPKSTTAARYTGRITVHTSEGDMEVPAEINVAGAVLEDSGDSEWWRGMSYVFWGYVTYLAVFFFFFVAIFKIDKFSSLITLFQEPALPGSTQLTSAKRLFLLHIPLSRCHQPTQRWLLKCWARHLP